MLIDIIQGGTIRPHSFQQHGIQLNVSRIISNHHFLKHIRREYSYQYYRLKDQLQAQGLSVYSAYKNTVINVPFRKINIVRICLLILSNFYLLKVCIDISIEKISRNRIQVEPDPICLTFSCYYRILGFYQQYSAACSYKGSRSPLAMNFISGKRFVQSITHSLFIHSLCR